MLFIIFILIVIGIGVDHVILRTKYEFMKWQNEATVIINNHDILLKRITDQMKVQTTPIIPEKEPHKKGP